MSTSDAVITPTIIRQSLRKLKPGKGDGDRGFFFEKKIYFTQRNKSTKKNYIPILQNLYTHTMEMQYIIYMQEACGPPHIDHYRSKLCSLYTSNDQL